MDNNKLMEEIDFLKKRVSILEKKESRRAAFKYLRIIGKSILVIAFAIASWKGYDYIVNGIPNMLEQKINELNPFKKK